MKISESQIRDIIVSVLQDMQNGDSAPVKADEPAPVNFQELGQAQQGSDPREVAIGLPAAFGVNSVKTIVDIPHATVLREVMAGIEEEGLTPRVVKVNNTADVAFIGHEAAKLSGSGIGIGILSRGTAVIHQKDLAPLENLELFPQAPILTLEDFRAMGRNAAKYAKGESPSPVPVQNDPMARPKFQGLAALLHNKEVQYVQKGAPSTEVRPQL